MGEGVNLDVLVDAIKEHGEDIRELRRAQQDYRAEWQAAHDKLRDNVAAEQREQREQHAADMREIRGMVATGLQQVRDDQQEGNAAIQEHLNQQDQHLEGRRNTWLLIVGSALATGAVTVGAAAAMHVWGL